jgi:hypothetical protein
MKQGSAGFMRTIFLGLCWSLATAIAVESRTDRSFADTSDQVIVHFRLQEKAVSLHEPVIVIFEVHNGMSQTINVTVGALIRQYFDFTLTTPSGQVLRKDNTPPPTMVTVGNGKVIVAPGEDYEEPLVMNQWFPFATEGTYTLTSKLTSEIESEDGNLQTGSETTQLRVNPRDPARLSKLSTELAKQAEIATTVDAALEPTLALSYVEDPVAVPYLAQVLSAHALRYDKAIAGLQRIGTDAAVEVLLSAMNDNYGDIMNLASSALSQMEDRIANPRLKETVKKAVERSSEQARNEFIKTQIAYLDYRSPMLQQTAIQELMRVEDGLQRAEPVLQRLANDPNQPADVRAAAKDALQKLHPKEP